MNFNLISPEGKADEFQIQFKDPITIKPNSQLELNWAEFERVGEVVFDRKQKMELLFENNIPTLKPSDSSENDDYVITIDIEAGEYTYTELQDKIRDEINSDLNDGDLPEIGTRYQSAEATSGILAGTGKANQGVFGINLKPTDIQEATFATSTHKKDAATSTTGGQACVYTTANNTGAYDNYALFDKHLDCYRAPCLDPDRQEDDLVVDEDGITLMESINVIDNQVGKIGFGVYGIEYATGIGTPPTRINGTNIVLQNGVPATFLWFEFGESTGEFIVYVAKNNSGQEIFSWDNQNEEITEMEVLHRQPMAIAFDTTARCKVAFEMFYTKVDTASPEIGFRIYENQTGNFKDKLLYDSVLDRRVFKFKMQVAPAGITYDNANAINSQIPYGLLASVQNQNQGWLNLLYPVFEKNTGVGDGDVNDTQPNSIVRDYKITCSEELAYVLSAPDDGIVSPLYPNSCQYTAVLLRTELDFNWRNKNYSIFINLPCNNFKNKQQENLSKTRDGGFKKSILANIPSPFTTGTVIAKEGLDAGKVISIYQPYQPIISKLENNEIQTNSIAIKVVNMLDETPADELIRFICNFTINNTEK